MLALRKHSTLSCLLSQFSLGSQLQVRMIAHPTYLLSSLQDTNKDSYNTPVNPHKSWLQFQNSASTYESSEKKDNLYKTKDGKVVVSYLPSFLLQTIYSTQWCLQISVVAFLKASSQFINGQL